MPTKGSSNAGVQHTDQTGCPFCAIDALAVVAETELAFAIRDAYPVTPLHTLVLPRRHVAAYFDLSRQELLAVDELLRRVRDDIIAADSIVEAFNGDVPDPSGGVRAIIPRKAAIRVRMIAEYLT